MPEHQTTDLLEREPTTAPLWRNRIYLKDGRSLHGYHFFTCRENAAAAIPPSEDLMRQWAPQGHQGVIERATGRYVFFFRDYSHAIPEPWSCGE